MNARADEGGLRRAVGALLRYGPALVIGAAGLVLGVMVPVRPTFRLPFITSLTVMIMVAAALGGLGPGVLATILCAAGVAYWLEPAGSFAVAPAEALGAVVFVVSGILVSAISGRMHRSMRLEAQARRLAERNAGAEAEARAAAEAAAVEVRSAQEAREEMLALVAHDLQDPLSVIDVSTALIERVAGADAQVQRRTTILHRTVRRTSRLVRDLLESSAIASGKLTLDPHPDSVERLFEETVEEHELQAQAKEIALEQDVPRDLPEVACDHDRVLQVLSNLVANALRFTPPHGRVRLRAEARERFVEVSVSDTGSGISADMLPRLFEPYSRERRERGGRTGLGLSVARAVVEGHGGRIGAESTVGEGSTFTFTLPVAAPAPAAP